MAERVLLSILMGSGPRRPIAPKARATMRPPPVLPRETGLPMTLMERLPRRMPKMTQTTKERREKGMDSGGASPVSSRP
jgi:hypothetical protein